MRNILIALVCLAVGALGALGYSHYLGEGKQLADLQDQLATANTNLAKASTDMKLAKRESEALSAQVQQLTSTKDDLKKQLDEAKSAAPAAAGPATAANPFANMGGMMKAVMAQQSESRLQLLIKRLNLTPEQIAQVKAAMDEESKRGEEMALKIQSGQKIDPQAMAADYKNFKSVDQTLNQILTPDQKVAYQQMQTDQKNSAAETMASIELNQLTPMLQLSESQKDQAYNALAQAQLQSQDPKWIKANATMSDPTSILDAQAKAKEDALSKILTPDQLATYHQQAQSQLDMQKSMMQKFRAQGGSGTGVVVSSVTTTPVDAPSVPVAPTSPAPVPANP